MKNGTTIKAGDAFVSKTNNGSIITVGMEYVDWEVMFGKNLLMFKSLDSLIPDEEDEITEEVKSEIKGIASMWFTDTNILFDEDYFKGKSKLIDEYVARVKKRAENVDKKEAEVVGSFFEEK